MSVLKVTTLLLVIGLFSQNSAAGGKKKEFHFQWDEKQKVGRCLNKDGKAGYNQQYLGPCGDLRGFDFPTTDLDGRDLRGANLDGMDLSGFSLNGSNLTGVHARGTNFSKAHLNGAKLKSARLEGARFYRSQMNGVDLSYAALSGAILERSTLEGASFYSANLGGAHMPSHLNTAILHQATLAYGTKIPFDRKTALKRGMVLLNHKVSQRVPAKASSKD